MGGLRDEKAFVRWAVADGVSVMGTSVSTVVLPLVVYEATGSSAATGGLFALRIIPYILFGAVAGPVADRKNRRRLIVGGHIIEGVLGATIPIAALFGVLTVAQVYAVGLLSACAFVFSDAAVFGAVPAMVGTDRLAAANGFLGSMVSAAEIAGPALGGILASTVGATNAVWFDSFSFFFAAAVQGSIRSSFRIGEPPTGPLQIKQQIGKAIRFVRGNRSVATLLLTGFGNSLGFGAVLGLLVPYAVQQLGLPEKDLRVGLLFSASGCGALIAGLLFSRVFSPIRVKRITPIAIGVSSVIALGLALSTSWVSSGILLVVFSWSIGTTVTTGITYRQLAAPDELRSSVNVFGRMISWGGQPFGAGIGAFVSAVVSVRAAFVVAAIAMAISAVCALVFLRPSTAIHPTTAPPVAPEPL
ncbi:MAG: major facilitator superfamily 1 [Ilumatobacteraceae bacterium]|nr:major facilitator superfamily 1 [Ilumatobacteraceae bacterium]